MLIDVIMHVTTYSDVEYRYYVHRVPYVEYSSKQVDPLMERDEVLADVGMHQAKWRLLRKRYSIRVEFEQTGSLGRKVRVDLNVCTCKSICYVSRRGSN